MTIDDAAEASEAVQANSVLPFVKQEPEAAWKSTIEQVVTSIVSIKYARPFNFDTSLSGTSQATGFVVDSERGYVLTNRHVVGDGPFYGYIIFSNYEEVDAYPIYRDPLHDFGILRYDPKAIRHLTIRALELRPDLAEVGVEIKVIGNDGGETLGILSGFISRLDRNAPDYSGYRDFNTCYYQANSSTNGGSSGSPVINVHGQAIALHAGGRSDGASTGYFLPLNSPLRALKLIQEGKTPIRGDVQTRFLLQPFDECRRLGLDAAWETLIRKEFPKQNSMLVARSVVPEGPAHNKIKEGDILLKVDDKIITSFFLLDDLLNGNVGQAVKFLLHRGGKDIEEEITVSDLEGVCPKSLLTVAGASFHKLSYQIASRYAIPCKGVYVCHSGSLCFAAGSGYIIERLTTKETPDMETFIEVMKGIPDRARVFISYRDVNDLHELKTVVIPIDKHWAPKMKMLTRNDTTGLWDTEILADALPPEPPAPCKATFPVPEHVPHEAVLKASRLWVEIWAALPFMMDTATGIRSSGMGLVVDADQGLVLVSRSTVPHKMCDINITIAHSVVVEGRVIFMHHTHNYAILQYDSKLVDAPVQTAVFSTKPFSQGHKTYFVGYSDSAKMVHAATSVTERRPVALYPSDPPRARPVNIDHIFMESSVGLTCADGAMMSDEGEIQAFWMNWEASSSNYHFGIGADILEPVISRIRQGSVPALRLLPVEFVTFTMAHGRVMGVPPEWIEKVEAKDGPNQLFMVSRVFGDQEGGMQAADLLLTLNGELITKGSQLDITQWHETLEAEIIRNGQRMTLNLSTLSADNLETDRFVGFCGVWIQKPHLALRQTVKKLPSEIYIVFKYYGSPASLYDLWPTNFITHINDTKTISLDDVLDELTKIPDNTYFQIRGETFHAVPFVTTIKKNEHYFPTMEWRKDPSVAGGWQKKTYENGQIIDGEGLAGICV